MDITVANPLVANVLYVSASERGRFTNQLVGDYIFRFASDQAPKGTLLVGTVTITPEASGRAQVRQAAIIDLSLPVDIKVFEACADWMEGRIGLIDMAEIKDALVGDDRITDRQRNILMRANRDMLRSAILNSESPAPGVDKLRQFVDGTLTADGWSAMPRWARMVAVRLEQGRAYAFLKIECASK